MDLIDDLESGTGSILPVNGRVGAWYTYNDETLDGMQTPAMGESFLPLSPGYQSNLAAHTMGSGFTVWGAGMGFDLNNDGVAKLTYNGNAYSGIRLWAQGAGTIRVKVTTAATTSIAEGGSCATNCDDAHGFVIGLTPNWAEHSIAFSQLTQEGWGTAASFDSSTLLSIQFQVTADAVFDFWIDDVSFF